MEENDGKVSNFKWILFLIILFGVLIYTIVIKITYKPNLTNIYVEEANTILFLANTLDKFTKSGIIEENKPNNINISVLRKDKEYKITSEKGVFVNEIKGKIDKNIITFEFSEILEKEDDIKTIFIEFFDDICQTKNLAKGSCTSIAQEFYENKESNNGIVFLNEENKIKIKIDINYDWGSITKNKYNFNELIPISERNYTIENEYIIISNSSLTYDDSSNTFNYYGIINYEITNDTSSDAVSTFDNYNSKFDINIYNRNGEILILKNKNLLIQENINNNMFVISLVINFSDEDFTYEEIGYISIDIKEEEKE